MAFDIAVVDAEAATRRHLALALAPVGYQVVSFADVESALQEIRQEPPRLVIADLLLPGPDGFELFEQIRTRYGDRVELLCTSGVEWGQIDLADVLARRFKAHLLKKPFLKSELRQLVQRLIGSKPVRVAYSGEWRIGVDDARRVDELSHDFERHTARVGMNRGRCNVRRRTECAVSVKRGGEWLRAGARNISVGGVFVEMIEGMADDWPSLDETLEVSIEHELLGRPLRVRARVAFRVAAQKGTQQGKGQGFGVEFVELGEEDDSALALLVRALLQDDEGGQPSSTANSGQAPVIWVLLVGIEAEELLRRPGFLHRQGIEIMSVSSTEAAMAFTEEHVPALCVVHEGVLGTEPGSALAPLSQSISGGRIIVVGPTSLSSLVAAGLCHAVLRPDTPMALLLDELRERLGVAQRRAPRVQAQGEVKIYNGPSECPGSMLNLSTGGMLLRSSQALAVGTPLCLAFDLPSATAIQCNAVVVRCESDQSEPSHLLGISFSEMDENTVQTLNRFVESHVHFREFFSWLKNAYFDGRLEPSE